MDVIVRSEYFLKAVVIFIPVILRQTEGQVFSWISTSTLTTILPCSNASNQLEFNWTYTATPQAPLIQWSKRNSVGTFENIATFESNTNKLTINAAYTSRFIRLGATAEFALKNPSINDTGFYKVLVTDSNGNFHDRNDTTTVKYEKVGTIQTKCRAKRGVGYTGTCSGTDEPNVPAECIELRKDGELVLDTIENGILSIVGKKFDDANITCSLCGSLVQCLPEPSSDICPDCQSCEKSGIAFLVITLASIVIGIVAIVVLKLLKSANLHLALYIVGAVWIGFGLIGTITVPVICSQVQPEDVFPCESVTIASFIVCIITCVGGVVTILLALFVVPGKTNTPPISPHPQDQPPKPIVTATTDVTSSQPVNSSSTQGRPSLGRVQSSKDPKSQAGNASLGDSENPESSCVTSASNVNAQVIVQHEATQQGEGNQTEKQKSKKKKKKKKMKVSEEVGEKTS